MPERRSRKPENKRCVVYLYLSKTTGIDAPVYGLFPACINESFFKKPCPNQGALINKARRDGD